MKQPGDSSSEVLSVLIVDDDEVDRMAVRRMLRIAGLDAQLEEVSGAEAALARLESGAFDCVLLDLQLPGMNGLELLREMRAADLQTPVVMLTAQGDEQVAVELMKAGAFDYIPKTALVPERLRQSVQNAIRIGHSEATARAAQEALRQSEERFRTLALQSAHIVWVWNPRDQLFEAPGWEAFTGQPESQMQHEGWLQILHPDDVERVKGEWEEAIAAERAVEIRFRIAAQNGRGVRHVISRGVPLRGADGRPREWVGGLTDVTEQRLREEEVQRRVEFEQQLVGIVSHDLRNPLSAIMISGSFLLNDPGLDQRQRRAAARVVASSERANRMIETLLDFTRARLGGGIPVLPRSTNLHEVVQQAVEEAQAAHPGREIHVQCGGNAQLTCDPERVEQVLANLISNALRHGDEKSTVEVVCRGEEERVVFTVHNAGEPIPAEALNTLFEPYRIASREQTVNRSGLGLGLYIVKEIVDAHGGEVEVHSSRAEGTTFRVCLPRARSAAA